jgi:hypothetical protein
MAEEMQGIMGLSNAQTPPDRGGIDPTQFSPVVESYARNNPREFGQDIMGGMAAADPALVQEFMQALSTMRLPTELIDAMQQMIDDIMANPEEYPESRAAYIAEGVPEELLPEQFDPAYFAALNIALDQLYSNQSEQMEPEVPTFAQGGIINVKNIARELSGMGRNGDTMLAHITPMEARMLRRRGGSGTINPETGLPEFFLKKIKKAVGKVFKAVGKAVESTVKAVGKVVKKVAASPIGKIALTAAAVYFMGPLAGKLGIVNPALANAVNTFAGNTLVNVASGQKIGDAIKGGLVAGAVAGAATSIFDGGVFGAKPAPTPAPAAIDAVDDLATSNVFTPSNVSAATPTAGAQSFPLTSPDASSIIGRDIGTAAGVADDFLMPAISSKSGAGSSLLTGAYQAPALTASNVVSPTTQASAATAAFEKSMGLDRAYLAGTPPTLSQKATGLYNQGKDFLSSTYDKISPSAIKANAIPAARDEAAKAVDDLLVRMPKASESLINTTYSEAYKDALPGVIGTYGPLAAVGLAGATAMGAFKPPKMEMPQNIDQFQTTGSDLLDQDPERFGLSYGGSRTTYAANPYEDLSNPGNFNFNYQNDPYANLYRGYGLTDAQRAQRYPTLEDLMSRGIGGVRQFAKGGEAYPRKTGHINGPGTGTSDSVPAMLSDGEFVFTAKAVRAMGQGSRRKGAKRMYALMKQLERKAS